MAHFALRTPQDQWADDLETLLGLEGRSFSTRWYMERQPQHVTLRRAHTVSRALQAFAAASDTSRSRYSIFHAASGEPAAALRLLSGMAHDNRESLSGKRVDLTDREEINRWRQIFGVTEEELRTAVQKAGASPERVREALRSRA